VPEKPELHLMAGDGVAAAQLAEQVIDQLTDAKII
jgi:hypothetical protein